MAKNKKEQRDKKETSLPAGSENKFSEQTEKIYKLLLKVMSWVVGISFALVIILPIFEDISLDPITTVVYRIGAVTLIAFTIIEFVSDHIKNLIENRTHGYKDSGNLPRH